MARSLERSRRFGVGALGLCLLALGGAACVAPREAPPRPSPVTAIVWPPSWPTPLEPACLLDRRPGRGLVELDQALEAGRLEAADRV